MMKRKWQPAAAALILLVQVSLWVGCKRPEQNIGLGIQPEEDILHAHQTDTTTLVAYTIREDSLRMDDFSKSMVGRVNDPVFGHTSASVYTQIRLTTSNVDFGDIASIEVDSIVLNVMYGDEIYGPATPQQFAIFEVLERIYLDSVYYSNQSLEIGTENLVRDELTPIAIDPNGYTTINDEQVQGMLRIPLDVELGQRFIDASGTDDLSNNETFADYFGGLYITSRTENAAVLQLDVINALSNVTLYYRSTGADADTLQYVFDLNANCARFTHWEHSYQNNLQTLASGDTLFADPYTYVRAGACAKTGIKFPFLKDYAAINGIIINKAELIVPATTDPSGKLDVPSFLFTRTEDDEGTTVELPDAITYNFNEGGDYDETNEEYRFIITRYIQEIINGERPDRGFSLVSNNGAISARRVILNGPSVSADDSSKNMRLILTYSE
ncbi:MAG: DUF4270 domain-containing protein [Flavobacteriales bacterium]|nr:DUF4270 domain-containing protein [Flavobacteriales bacterium]